MSEMGIVEKEHGKNTKAKKVMFKTGETTQVAQPGRGNRDRECAGLKREKPEPEHNSLEATPS